MTPRLPLALALAGVLAASLTAADGADRIAYPEGYRAWPHVKSMVIHDRTHPLFEAFGGIHHVYVNPRGAAAARAGGPYPDGTVFVFDLLEAPAQGGAITEGARKFVAVMVKDTAAFADTGGWGFQAFKGSSRDQRLVTDAKTQCFACHQSQKPRDHVFSTWRD
ncbi:MAG TPA: cytochrome P460 family protein [Candidatus Binatia bacterium]|nr:cytochrome P460 family protein [Candidatus Binatia bacterium]